MSSQPGELTASRHRPVSAIGIVVLSLVLPAAVAGWSVLAAMRDKGIAMLPSKAIRYYFGSVKKGELWHSEIRVSSNTAAPPTESRILRLDLETGVERDPGLSVPGDFGWAQWMEGTLYFTTQTAVFRQADDGFVKLAALPTRSASFYATLFLWEGRLTTIQENDDGGHRLVHLSEGKWIDGRPILLPETTRVWHDDAQRDCRILLPLTSQQPTSAVKPSPNYVLQVVPHGQQHHVMITDYSHFSAYRTGFEFADEPHDAASALAPENAARDVTGWEPIGPPHPKDTPRWMHMTACRDGVLFLSWDSLMHVARRKPDGSWDRLIHPRERPRMGGDMILSDPDETAVYIIGTDQQWGAAEVLRVEGNTVQPVHLVVPGFERPYLARWKRLSASLLFAWWLHIALLIGGAAWLTHGVARPEFEFGNQRAALAPLWRRAIATAVDAVLLVTAILWLGRFLFVGLGIETRGFDETTLAHGLFEVEQGLYSAITGTPTLQSGTGFRPAVTSLLQTINTFPQLVVLLLAALLVVCGAKVLAEGRYGVTPGKWLLGLRTVKTTLRPCGFARALVRNAVYYVDLPLLLTPLPAAISLMFSDHRQRLGDRAADALVIRARSIREVGHIADTTLRMTS